MMHYVCIYMYHCCDSARGNGFKLQRSGYKKQVFYNRGREVLLQVAQRGDADTQG